MNSLEHAVDQLLSLHDDRYERRQGETVATITGLQTDDATGQRIVAVTATVGYGARAVAGVVIPTSEPASIGERRKLFVSADPIGQRYTLGDPIVAAAPSPVTVDGRAMPTLTLGTPVQVIDYAAPGGYDVTLKLRFRTWVPGSYLLYDLGIRAIGYRVRRQDQTNWEIHSADSVSLQPADGVIGRWMLTADCTSGATTISAEPVTAGDAALMPKDGVLFFHIGQETISGTWNGSTSITGVSRGLEGTTAAAHVTNDSVILMTAEAIIPGLQAATDYYIQIRPVDTNGVKGLYVPASPLAVTTIDQTAVPKDVTNLTVDSIQTGYEVRWTHVTQDANTRPLHDRIGYIVRRFTSADWASATKLTNVSTGLEEVVSNNYLQWPAAQVDPVSGLAVTGGYFGVVAVRRSGVQSANPVWAHDTTAPPAPLPDSIVYESLPAAIRVYYVASQDAADVRADRGFKEFVLNRATSNVGAAALAVAVFSGTDTVYVPPRTGVYYYQVSARDWDGNTSALTPTGTYWIPAVPYGDTDLFIDNGNFQIPGPSRTVTDGAITSGTSTFTSATAKFTERDIDSRIVIVAAGLGSVDLYTRIASVTNATTVDLQNQAQHTVSGASATIGGFPRNWSVSSGQDSNWTINYNSTGGTDGSRVILFNLPALTYGYGNLEQYIRPIFSKNFNQSKTTLTMSFYYKVTNGATLSGSMGMALYSDDFGITPISSPSYFQASLTCDGAWHLFTHDFTGPWAGANSIRFFMGPYRVSGTVAAPIDFWIDDVSVALS